MARVVASLICVFAFCADSSLWLAARSWAVEASSSAKSLADTGTRPTAKTPVPLDRETEARAKDLVSSHLPALKVVLERLQSDQPREYDRAIRDLARSARKLETAKGRDENLYEAELELLQAQTEATLLTAKLKVRDNASDRKRLREAAARLQQAQVSRAEYEVLTYQQRLEKAEKLLKSAEQRLAQRKENAKESIEKSYSLMLRKAGRTPSKTGEPRKSDSQKTVPRRTESRKTGSKKNTPPAN
ncbi:MAG: hypothetical protein ACR2NZ_12675 [Rubripirellula sp.]